MRRETFWIAASCILVLAGLLPAFSSGASPASNEPAAKEKAIYSFQGGSDGFWPSADLTLDSNGNLYGTTFYGGTSSSCVYGCGTVFELKRSGDGWKKETLHDFGFNDGGFPAAGMIFDSVGNLYGTTSGGFNTGLCGNVFRLTPNSHGGWTESVLYTFTCGNDGDSPEADLVFDANGDLFGTTSGGGASRGGTVFELVPQASGPWKEITLHDFTGTPDGTIPSSGVALDSSGNVWGTTTSGGTGKCEYIPQVPGCGIVYELTPNSPGNWTETVVYNFVRGGGNAVTPSSGFILQSGGHLFATTTAGGDGLGTLLELTQSQKGWQQNILYRFYGDPDGEDPVGQLEAGAAGTFLGATNRGGKTDCGTVFELEHPKADVWREMVLHSFVYNSNDGCSPPAGLVSDSSGHLYGTTTQGGGTGCQGSGGIGCGTVYEITLDGQER
jgi:uncharacterized repeat protein (TIGR03803 family)